MGGGRGVVCLLVGSSKISEQSVPRGSVILITSAVINPGTSTSRSNTTIERAATAIQTSTLSQWAKPASNHTPRLET